MGGGSSTGNLPAGPVSATTMTGVCHTFSVAELELGFRTFGVQEIAHGLRLFLHFLLRNPGSEEGFLFRRLLAGSVVAAGFLELLLHGIRTSLVFPKKSFVPWFILASVDGSLFRLGAADLELKLGSDMCGKPRPDFSSETLAWARLLAGDFLNGFSFETLQPSSAAATLANEIATRLATAIQLRLLTA